jgi:hypothetical protein
VAGQPWSQLDVESGESFSVSLLDLTRSLAAELRAVRGAWHTCVAADFSMGIFLMTHNGSNSGILETRGKIPRRNSFDRTYFSPFLRENTNGNKSEFAIMMIEKNEFESDQK